MRTFEESASGERLRADSIKESKTGAIVMTGVNIVVGGKKSGPVCLDCLTGEGGDLGCWKGKNGAFYETRGDGSALVCNEALVTKDNGCRWKGTTKITGENVVCRQGEWGEL